MHPITTIPRHAPAIRNTLTVAVAANADAARHSLDQVDVAGPAVGAIRAMGLAAPAALTAGGVSWRPAGGTGRIVVDVDTRVEPDDESGCWLTIVTRFSATDERAHARLLDAWPLIDALSRTLVQRAARAVKAHAEAHPLELPRAVTAGARLAA